MLGYRSAAPGNQNVLPNQTQLEALKRLWKLANGHSGHSRTAAHFLLGIYNGQRFPFDLSDFRKLDARTFDDCLLVVQMDYRLHQEVHGTLGVGSEEFEWLALSWGIGEQDAAEGGFIQ